MADIKKLIEAAIEKKPLDIKEMINEIMTEKVRGVVTETVHGFEYEDELTEEEELAAFFEEFHAEYGHLTEEEQLAIMDELVAEEELCEVTHHQVQLEVSHDDADKQVDLQHRGKQDNRGKIIHTKFVTVRATPDEDENASLVAAAKQVKKQGYRVHAGAIHSTHKVHEDFMNEACCSKCDCDPCECGNKGKGKKSSGAGMSPAAMAKAVRANPSQDSVTKEEFFAAFQEEYGHLPLDEQEAIMANLDEADYLGYKKDAVDKEIKKDPKIKGKEAKKIQGLLKGWRGSK